MKNKIWSILLGLLVFSICIVPTDAIEREDCGSYIGTPEVAGTNRPEMKNETLRVYPLHVGDTLVPFEQFYGGTETWDTTILNVMVNSERFFWVPLYMYLIIHPDVGPILVDTAVNEEMVYNYDDYFRGVSGVTSKLMREEYMLDEAQTIPNQLTRFGYTPEDIELVILTHAHDDHVGGLPYFQHARIITSDNEFAFIDFITNNILPVQTKYYEGVGCWEVVSFTDEAVANFEQSQDVLGDGSIILLSAPGHTPGSLLVLVNMGTYNLLITGDTIYTIAHLDPDNVLQLIPDTDSDEIANMVRQVLALRNNIPNTFIVPAHDHTGYLENIMSSLMACGILTEATQENIHAYQNSIFNEDGHILSDAMPTYIANEDGSIYGEVTTPEVDLPNLVSEDCGN